MISQWQWVLRQLSRQMWVRVSIFSLAAVAVALAGVFLARFVPEGIARSIGSDSIDDILQILATSMLAVTTFSLTTMVSAYSAATNSVTPRAAKLLMDDTTAQNALGTFIGSFLFSLVGIVALSTGAYGEQGRVILFLATVAVIVLIVVTLLRWIDYLSHLGRVGETTDRIERAALDALDDRMRRPGLGGRVIEDAAAVPEDAQPVFCESMGYVQHVDIGALSRVAEAARSDVFVNAPPGTFADHLRPVAHVSGGFGEDALRAVRAAFAVASERSFTQDPRFGLCVLSEIASCALSPAVNDPGTAIDVLGRAERILCRWAGREDDDASTDCPRVWVPALRADDMFDDLFAPIARDGAGLLEVQVRLQKVLRSLAATGDPEVAAAARRHAGLALARAEKTLVMEHERTRLRELTGDLARHYAVPES